MNKTKGRRLERKRWKVGDTNEFLGLSVKESKVAKPRLSRKPRQEHKARRH